MAGEESIGGLSAYLQMDDSALNSGMARLLAAIEHTEGGIASLNAKFAAGLITAEEYATKLGKSEASLKSLERASASLQAQLTAQSAAHISAAQMAEAATAAQVAAQAKAMSYSGAWSNVTATSAATMAQVRERERAMTVLPISGLQASGLRVQDQFRIQDEAERIRAEKRRAYVEGVRKWDDDTDGRHPKFRDEASKGKMGGLGYQLQLIGQMADDMQYMSEMGLRPIINNLMQMNPLLGLAAIGIDQMRKHGGELIPIVNSLAESMGLAFRMTAGEDTRSLDQRKQELGKRGMSLGVLFDEAKTYAEMIGESAGDVTGITRRSQDAAIKAFEARDDPEAKKTGKDVAGVIAKYGNKEFLKALTDPNANPDETRAAKTELMGLVGRAEKGDSKAIKELQERTAGVRTLGRDVSDVINEKAMKAESDQLIKEGEAGANLYDFKKKAEDKYRAATLAGGDAEAKENEENFKDYLEKKIKSGPAMLTPLTEGERAAAPEELLEKRREMLRKEGREGEEKRETYDDRMAKLALRMRRLAIGEVRESRVMSAADLTASVQQSITNDPMLKLLKIQEEARDIQHDLRDAIADFNKPVKAGSR